MDTEIGRLGGCGFQGAVTTGDGSNQKGEKMGIGFIDLRREKTRKEESEARRGRL